MARLFIHSMQGRAYAPIYARRWTRAFKKAGVPIIHGPVSLTRTGNWAPKAFYDAFKEARTDAGFRKVPFHLQVDVVVWWLKRGTRPRASLRLREFPVPSEAPPQLRFIRDLGCTSLARRLQPEVVPTPSPRVLLSEES